MPHSLSWARFREFMDQHWLPALAGTAAATLLLSFIRVFFSSSPPPMTGDAAYWQHTGWYIAQGATPFVDMLGGKLLSLETVTILGVLTGGNVYALHVVSVLLTAGVAAGTAVLAGRIVHAVTGNGVAAFLGGLGVLAFPAAHYVPVHGFQGKIYALFFGLLSVHLFLSDRAFWSGVTAAASAGYWPLGIIFPATVLARYGQERGTGELRRAVGGMAAMTVAAVLPVVIAGLTVPMLVQTVLMPLYGSGSGGVSLVLRLGKLGLLLGYAGIVVLIGLYDAGRTGRTAWREHWWLPVLVGWFTLQILFIDFDWVPDLLPVTAVTAIGAGVAVDRVDVPWDRVCAAFILLAAAVSIIGLGGFGILTYPIDAPEYPVNTAETAGRQPLLPATAVALADRLGVPVTIDAPGPSEARKTAAPDLPSMTTMYWNRVEPETCRYRFGPSMQAWMAATNTSWDDPCGQLPPGLF